jgi:hypothetical protein
VLAPALETEDDGALLVAGVLQRLAVVSTLLYWRQVRR